VAQGEVCAVANLNGFVQIVIAGHKGAIDRAVALARERGAKKATVLAVSAPFHSPLMAPAVDGLREALSEATFSDPAFPVIANASGEAIRTGVDAKRLLADQLTAPVRWVACMRAAAELAPDAVFIEVGPGNVLSGLLKRIVPNARAIQLGTAAEVEQFLTLSLR